MSFSMHVKFVEECPVESIRDEIVWLLYASLDLSLGYFISGALSLRGFFCCLGM